VVTRLKLVERVDLGELAARRRVDLFKVLSVYNFSFWFDEVAARVVLELDPPAVAVVSVRGEAALYAPGAATRLSSKGSSPSSSGSRRISRASCSWRPATPC